MILSKLFMRLFNKKEKRESIGVYHIYMITPLSKYARYKYIGYTYMTKTLHMKYNHSMYELVYSGKVYPDKTYGANNVNVILDNIFYELNMHRPKDYTSPSLSIGDVISISANNGKMIGDYLVDSEGFVKLEDFWKRLEGALC